MKGLDRWAEPTLRDPGGAVTAGPGPGGMADLHLSDSREGAIRGIAERRRKGRGPEPYHI
jgi:hypothetical protein